VADFFGRVKDKAGDLERTLKEKDRHGTKLALFTLLICFYPCINY